MTPLWLSGASRYLSNNQYSSYFVASLTGRALRIRQRLNCRAPVLRNASSLSSATAVNATKIVPSKYKTLYESLQRVRRHAAIYVDLSRLDLALQGLETEKLKTRIAVLGINGTSAARLITKLLLADPLKEKEAWEDDLDISTSASGILLKYGELRDPSLTASRAAIETLPIPSRLLRDHNLEILIGSINSTGGDPTSSNDRNVSSDVLLSPTVDIPTSSSGRTTTVRFPVHKAFLVAKGFDELLLLFRLLSITQGSQQNAWELVERICDMRASVQGFSSSSVVPINSSIANQGLESIREDLTKTPDYERLWRESAMDNLKAKIQPSIASSSQQLPEPLSNLIRSILFDASSAAEKEALESVKTLNARSVKNSTRETLSNVLDLFTRRAHTELQSGIETAYSSSSWKKLNWYKLLWRVDDVPLIVSDLVERYWLPQSERAFCEFSGRLVQAGLSPAEPGALAAEDLTRFQTQFWDLQSSILASKISDARRALTHISSSDLTIKAQSALAKMLAFSGGSGVLAATAYFSLPTAGLYESGCILALGIIFALRKLQVDWESYRRYWRKRIFEAGTDTIKDVESQLRQSMRDGGKAVEDGSDLSLRTEAQSAIQGAQEALSRLS
ncbi:MAG: hypothetical protein Q9160_007125 [Pyrenula sp. 1 TL-2023]